MEVVFEGTAVPKASILFVCRNQTLYSVPALESVLNQEGLPLEIIISDDASTDETFSVVSRIARNYRGPHKVVLNRNEQRLGLNHITFLVEKASCDFQIQAHGDDIAFPNRCARLWQIALEKKAHVVGSAAIRIDAKGREIPWHRSFSNSIMDANSIIRVGSIAGMFGAVLAWDRAVFTRFPRLEESYLAYGHGTLLCFRAALLSKVYYEDEPLLYYRHHPQQWSREIAPRLDINWVEEIELARQLSIRIAMLSDVQHLLQQDNGHMDLTEILETLNSRIVEMAQQWSAERQRIHARKLRPIWIQHEDYLSRFQGIRSRINHPLAREIFYWSDRAARFLYRYQTRSK